MSRTRPAETSSLSTRPQGRWSRRLPSASGRAAFACRATARSCSSRLSGSPIGGPGVDESKLPPPDRTADGIGVVDLATHKLIRKYQSGEDPEVFDISPDGSTIYVSNEDAAQASVVDIASGNVVARISVGENPKGSRSVRTAVWCSSRQRKAGDVAVIDTKTRKLLVRIKTGPRPRSVTFSKDGAIAFVPSETAGLVSIIDVPKRKVVSTIHLPKVEGAETPPRPMGGVLSPDGTPGLHVARTRECCRRD